MSFPGYRYSVRVATQGELNAVHTTPLGEDGQLEGHAWSLLDSTLYVFSFADFNLYPFAVINHDHEYISFSEFCEYFKQVTEPEVHLGDLPTHSNKF